MDNAVKTNSVNSFYNNIDRIKNGESLTHEEKYPLKWHYFLTYFALWAGSILNLASGYVVFEFLSDMMNRKSYFWYPEISVTGLAIYGIMCVIFGIYGIVIRFKLANFRENAPQHLIAMNILSALIPLIVDKCFSLDMGTSLTMLAGGIVAALINSKYYGKRSSLFIC